MELYMPPVNDIIVGSTALAIAVTGWIITFSMFLAMRHSDSKLLPFQGLFVLNMAMNFTGTGLSFVWLVFTGYNIANVIVIWLAYTTGPLGIATAMYVGFSMIKPKAAKPLAWIYAATGIPHLASVWFNWLGYSTILMWDRTYLSPGYDVPAHMLQVPGTLIDTGVIPPGLFPFAPNGSLAYWMIMFYLLSFAIILGGGFIYLAFRSSGEIRSRSIKYAIGILLYAILIYVDAAVTPPANWIISPTVFLCIIRAGLLVGYITLYFAMRPPKTTSAPVKAKDYYPT
jgi:hypothetical protein